MFLFPLNNCLKSIFFSMKHIHTRVQCYFTSIQNRLHFSKNIPSVPYVLPVLVFLPNNFEQLVF